MTNAVSQAEHDATQTAVALIPTTAMRGTDGVDTATMRGTDGANTVVPMAVTLSQTEHDATQSSIAALNDVAATDIVSNGAITTSSGKVSTVGDVTGDVQGSVASVTGNVGGNVVGSVGSVVANVGALIKGFITGILSETSTDRINNNFEKFYNNSTNQTTKKGDDVGGAGSS